MILTFIGGPVPEDIRGRNVPVNDTETVDIGQAVANRDGNRQTFPKRELGLADPVAQ